MRTDDRVTAAGVGRSRLRASDSDRDRVLDILKAAFVQGRLTKDELDARVGQTLASRTWGDLSAITADIPPWPLPRPVRKPARSSASPPTPAVVKAVACAIIAMATVAIAGMPGMWMPPPPPSMTAQACQSFYTWQNPTYRGIANLGQAAAYASSGTDPRLAGDLANLQVAVQRSEEDYGGVPQSMAATQHYASQIKADTANVSADCAAAGYPY
ncbi:MAG TPA: DUF1707 domain-containing protein [Streptosporangiaceae bacterium]|nr:DUF1707 domain-containing protein [Streptosporangiaceae bacterium]